MSTTAIDNLAAYGCAELDPSAMEELAGGLMPVWMYAVGGYLLKTIGDNWGDFKEGVQDGFEAVT